MPPELSWALYVLYLAAATVVLVVENRSPQSTFAWLFLMVLAPGVGPVVYFMFGRGSNAFSHRKAMGNQLDILQNASEKYPRLLEDLRQARGAAHATAPTSTSSVAFTEPSRKG